MLRWYVRRRGDVLGPFTLDEMRAMCESASIGGFDEVSLDQQVWRPVRDIPAMARDAEQEIEKPSASPATGTKRPRGAAGRSWGSVWGIFALVLIGLLVIAICLVLHGT